jgi:GAF domain-containing protein
MRPIMAQETNRMQDNPVVEHLQDLVLESGDVQELLDELATFSAQTLSGSEELLCGITLLRRKKAATLATSDPRVMELDEMQYGLDDGPCLTAIRDLVTIHVPDLREEHRWPEYTPTAWRQGIGSTLSVPLVLEGEANAGLNLYSTSTHSFSGEDIEAAEAYAGQASKALRLSVRIAQLTDARRNLSAAMESRTVIDLAAGAIMAQNRCNQETAMKIMKIASSSRNVKLREVAASIVASLSEDPKIMTHFEA